MCLLFIHKIIVKDTKMLLYPWNTEISVIFHEKTFSVRYFFFMFIITNVSLLSLYAANICIIASRYMISQVILTAIGVE